MAVRSASRRRITALALVAILVAAVVVALIASRRTSAHERRAALAASALSLTVSGAPTGHAIPSGFLGLSLEYPAIEAYAGNDPKALDPVFLQLIRNLTLGQAPNLRMRHSTSIRSRRCYISPSQPQCPTIAHMLSPEASRGLADKVAALVPVAHARHVPLRIDEMNTVSCGSAPRLGDGFVSALWALDAVFQMARVGVDGVNIHSYPNAPYELFTFARRHGRWSADVAPEYYGLLMFAQAAPPGARLLRTSGALGDVRAWATRAPDGTIHVVLINDYTAQARTIALHIAGATAAATLERLRAPGVTARTGVTLGGQGFGTATTTGLLSGRSAITSVDSVTGAYAVRRPPASAAMLTIPPTAS